MSNEKKKTKYEDTLPHPVYNIIHARGVCM